MSPSLKKFCIQAIHGERRITHMEMTLRKFCFQSVIGNFFFNSPKASGNSYLGLKNVQMRFECSLIFWFLIRYSIQQNLFSGPIQIPIAGLNKMEKVLLIYVDLYRCISTKKTSSSKSENICCKDLPRDKTVSSMEWGEKLTHYRATSFKYYVFTRRQWKTKLKISQFKTLYQLLYFLPFIQRQLLTKLFFIHMLKGSKKQIIQ